MDFDFTTYMQMDGYALYVWGAYGVALVGYLGLMLGALIQYERLKKNN